MCTRINWLVTLCRPTGQVGWLATHERVDQALTFLYVLITRNTKVRDRRTNDADVKV
jgi:hypothetical protein